MPLRRVPELHGKGIRLFPKRLVELIKTPDNVEHYAWDEVHHLAQFALMGMYLWKCGKDKLRIAAEICRMHPDLKEVVAALYWCVDEGVRTAPFEPGKEET